MDFIDIFDITQRYALHKYQSLIVDLLYTTTT
jgi:hypothetical protein